MKIAELKGLPNWQTTAVIAQTGHAVAMVRAGNDGYHLKRGQVHRGAFNLLRSVGGPGNGSLRGWPVLSSHLSFGAAPQAGQRTASIWFWLRFHRKIHVP